MKTDIVIIGGGVAGLTAGAALAPHASVVVLEREGAVGYHASGRSAALFERHYGPPSVLALNEASAEAHTPYLTPRGFLLLGQAHEGAEFDADLKAMHLAEISVEDACGHVPILRPDRIARAAHNVTASDIDTDRMLQDAVRTIRSHGGRVELKACVTAIRHADDWQVETGTDVLQAKTLINAAGAWADEIAAQAGITPVGITPKRRSMARLAAPGGHDTRNWPMFFGTGERWYAKPDAGSLLVSPAEADPVAPQDVYPDDMVLAEGLARYQDVVTPEVTRPQATWAGLRSFAPDGTLVLGRDPGQSDFVWCAGQGGYGFQTAPAASGLIRDIVLGRSPDLPDATVAALAPDRFHT